MTDQIVERVDVWAAPIRDEVGSVAWLLDGLKDAGADLDFIIARRTPETPGAGVVFVTPLRGDAEIAAAANLGFNVSNNHHAVRIEGDNRPGIAAELTNLLATNGINLRGFSTAVIGTRFIAYVGLHSAADATRAFELFEKAAVGVPLA